jgi:lipoprotein-anchoring transpeptidase ErfK/SrfK
MWSAASIGAALIGAVLVTPILLGRTSPPLTAVESARRAVARARTDGATVWAPRRLESAEETLHEGLTEYRRQELRFISLRNFTEARRILALAEDKAVAALEEAIDLRDDARSEAEESMNLARKLLGEAEAIAETTRVAAYVHARYRRARTRLVESEEHFQDGAYLAANAGAELASAEARGVIDHATTLAARFVDKKQLATWRKWIDETLAWSRRTNEPAIIVYKEKNLVGLYVDGKPVRSYRADMGRNNLDRKLSGGDSATPEGRYKVVDKKDRGRTKYYKALLLDYPNKEDLRRFEQARAAGRLPRNAKPGSLIEIHGEGGRGLDWTYGCPALSNKDMDDLYSRVRVGTPVTIVGGDGRAGRFSNLVLSNNGGTSNSSGR